MSERDGVHCVCMVQGLYEVLCSNSKLAEPIIELLLTQVRQVAVLLVAKFLPSPVCS